MKLFFVRFASLVLVIVSTFPSVNASPSNTFPDRSARAKLSTQPAFQQIPRGGGLSSKQSVETKPATDTTGNFRLSGDLGNLLTVVLSIILLVKTPFNVKNCGLGGCDAFYDNGDVYSGDLDSCYVCDGFCISNAENSLTNSHMLSLYADIAMFIPLVLLRWKKQEELESMQLDDFFISSLKVNSVLGHGVAHMSLSLLERFGKERSLNGPVAQRLVSVGILLARFVHPNTLTQLRAFVNRAIGQQVDAEVAAGSAEAHRKSFLRSAVAPFLTGISLAQLTNSPVQPGLINYVIFGLTCFVFFEAGIPPAQYNWIFSIIMSGIATYLSVGIIGVQNVQQSFVIVFTSSYLVSALYQMFVWGNEAKTENAKAYAVSAWSSNIFTTLVGWALALKCTQLKDFGGHVLYDLSISASYFLIYVFQKMLQ